MISSVGGFSLSLFFCEDPENKMVLYSKYYASIYKFRVKLTIIIAKSIQNGRQLFLLVSLPNQRNL